MFISRADKDRIEQSIRGLLMATDRLNNEVVYLNAKIKALEANRVKQPKAKKQMTEAQRAKQREYAKRYQAKKRMEKKNGNSVSTPSV
jgi:hypothetical protein